MDLCTTGIEIPNNEISVANDDGTYLDTKAEVEEEPLPSHICLCKDANLKEKAKDMSDQIENLEEEFFNLVDYVKENVKNEINIATREGNREHNRYMDIGSNTFNFLTAYVDIIFQPLLMTISSVSRMRCSRAQKR